MVSKLVPIGGNEGLGVVGVRPHYFPNVRVMFIGIDGGPPFEGIGLMDLTITVPDMEVSMNNTLILGFILPAPGLIA